METIEELNIRISFNRKSARWLLAVFFLCWHPGFIGSESLTLTTYYPAPYGGYVSILTTNRTLLARDAGSVGIGTAGPIPANVKLGVHSQTSQGNISISGVSDSGNTYSSLHLNDENLSPNTNSWGIVHKRVLGTPEANDFQLAKVGGGVTRIDLVVDSLTGNVGINTTNPTERLHVGNGNLRVQGNVSIQGTLSGLCTWRGMVGTGWSYCVAGENLVNTNFTSWVSEWACFGMKDNFCIAGTKTTGLSGNMLCCRIQ